MTLRTTTPKRGGDSLVSYLSALNLDRKMSGQVTTYFKTAISAMNVDYERPPRRKSTATALLREGQGDGGRISSDSKTPILVLKFVELSLRKEHSVVRRIRQLL
jgi:hypothetical protein